MSVKIRMSFILYMLSIGTFSSWTLMLCALFSLLVHETGHYCVCRLLGEQVSGIELTPFGGIMVFSAERPPKKGLYGIAVAAAGPLANYALILLISVLHTQNIMTAEFVKCFLFSNLAMICINLLPAFPLDGGRIVFNAGFYFFRLSSLLWILTLSGILCGLMLAAFSVYGFVRYSVLNISLLIVGIQLSASAAKNRASYITENLYSILHEKRGRYFSKETYEAIRLFLVREDTPVFRLADIVASPGCSGFIFQDAQHFFYLDEQMICSSFLQNPMTKIGDIPKKSLHKLT